MEPIQTFTATMAPLPINDIDTDQIIPARFLKVTDKKGLGANAFSDWRYESDGNPKPDFVLNKPEYQSAQVLIGGHNFGCGSSREHAPWALVGAGMKAVVSTYFADIFRNNALKNGLLPVEVDEATHRQLISLAEEDPTSQITIDLASQTVTLPDGRQVQFPIDGFSKHCLLNGVDQMGYLISLQAEVETYEGEHPSRINSELVRD
ncbi:MAG: 3-isopropylmalate dehydratase small subunit [Phototrophicaceae bacterium]